MKKALLFLIISLTFSCTNEGRARKTLEAQGFTNIRFTGHSYLSCSKDDTSCTGFEATGPSGIRVTGAVGCGAIQGCGRGCTIRID